MMTRKWMLRRIGLWSAMKMGFTISAVLGLIMGFFWGVVFAFFTSLFATAASLPDPGIGAGAILVMPVFGALFSGVMGALTSFLAALAYNLAAGFFGGINLEIETEEAPPHPETSESSSPPEAVLKKPRRVWKQPPSGLAARRGGAAW
jgi:hypothetical protein